MAKIERLSSGKLPAEMLFAALRPVLDQRVLQGPGLGRDAAIIELGDLALVATSDPITFVDAQAGKLAVTINANDILSVGAEPEWLLATILAPVGSSSRRAGSVAGGPAGSLRRLRNRPRRRTH